VTNFVSEACQAVDVLGKYYAPPRTLTLSAPLQDLKKYFARPRIISSGSIPLGTTNRIVNADLDSGNLFTNYFPNARTRLAGVYGMRFKLVFTLQVSTTPFHQGVLALAWQYQIGSVDGANYYDRAKHPSTVMNLPHVRCDLSTDTMAQLSIPYLNVYEFLEIPATGTFTEIGKLSLTAVLPVNVGAGGIAPTYNLMVHLEDLEFIGARPENVTSVTLQSGRKLKPMNEEFENEAYPFSSSLSALSRSVKWIAKGVPAISSIAGPTSWFLQKTAGAVRAFGFSKPQIQEPIMRVGNIDSVFEHNIDTPSGTIMVAPTASNQLRVDSSFAATDVDEMSLAYVLSQWGHIATGQMLSTSTRGTDLYITRCSPSFFWWRSIAAQLCNKQAPVLSNPNTNSFQPSHLFFFGQMFRFWRGGFRFRITFGKTKLHGGRVVAWYNPLYETSFPNDGACAFSEPNSVDTMPFGQSLIFDLRDGNSFEFDVPFTSPLPFLRFGESFGTFGFTVLDPLQAPNMVANAIPFMVEVKALPDFEFACPRAPKYAVHNFGTIKTQSGKVLPAIDASAAELTVGESINSVKQLIMIPKYGAMSDKPSLAVQGLTMLPWYYQPNLSPSTTSFERFPEECFGFAGNIASCYAYARGSTDAHVYHPALTPMTISATLDPTDIGKLGEVEDTADPRNSTVSAMPRVMKIGDGALHVRFPAYQRAIRYLTTHFNNVSWSCKFGALNSTPTFNITRLLPPVLGKLYLRLLPKDDVKFDGGYVSRCAGDDAMLGHYMGPPPLALTSTYDAGVYEPEKLTLDDGFVPT